MFCLLKMDCRFYSSCTSLPVSSDHSAEWSDGDCFCTEYKIANSHELSGIFDCCRQHQLRRVRCRWQRNREQTSLNRKMKRSCYKFEFCTQTIHSHELLRRCFPGLNGFGYCVCLNKNFRGEI